MANNVITAVIPKLLAQGMMALRENAITPRLVANKTTAIAGKKGSTLDVPIPSAITAVDVVPAATAPNAAALTPSTVPVTLDQWKEAPFDLDDNEYEQAMDGVIPMQASAAIRAIVNSVDTYLLSLYKGIYGYQGTAGTTPFGSGVGIVDATGIRKVLNKQLAPMDDRHCILDPDAEAAALGLQEFNNANFSGSFAAMQDGKLNQKLGMNWWMNQNIPTHTSTPFTAGAVTVNGVHAAGVTTVSIAKATNTTPLVAGDVIIIGGRSYAVAANVTLIVGNTNVTLSSPLRAALAGGETVTKLATHVVNLAMHRDCLAFANRPLVPAPNGLGSISMSQVDPISGLALRIEVTREHKRTRWSYDMLYGAALVRPELGARLLG